MHAHDRASALQRRARSRQSREDRSPVGFATQCRPFFRAVSPRSKQCGGDDHEDLYANPGCCCVSPVAVRGIGSGPECRPRWLDGRQQCRLGLDLSGAVGWCGRRNEWGRRSRCLDAGPECRSGRFNGGQRCWLGSAGAFSDRPECRWHGAPRPDPSVSPSVTEQAAE